MGWSGFVTLTGRARAVRTLKSRHGSALCYRRHRFPPEIIQHAIWLYLRFTLSYRDVEELLAERGLDISYETVRRWVLKFGPTIARRLRQRRPRPSDRAARRAGPYLPSATERRQRSPPRATRRQRSWAPIGAAASTCPDRATNCRAGRRGPRPPNGGSARSLHRRKQWSTGPPSGVAVTGPLQATIDQLE